MPKKSKAEANYRPGDPLKHCGLCVHYHGGKCSVVSGGISPYKVSDHYKAHQYSGDRFGPNNAPAPPMQIGNRSYA